MEQFSALTQEKLGYYVYCLVDPTDGKVFYVGKGKGNRVFQHALHAEMDKDAVSEKLDKIREIHARTDGNNHVQYYIVRHGLEENEAFEIESVLIDFLTYPSLNKESVMTNLQAGHDQRLRGIRTAEDIEADYAAKDIEVSPDDYLLLVNISASRGAETLYDAAKGDWVVGQCHLKKITHVLAHYNGVVRAVFHPKEWTLLPKEPGKRQRVRFEGTEVTDSPYINTSVRRYTFSAKNRPNQNPVQYLDGNVTIEHKSYN